MGPASKRLPQASVGEGSELLKRLLSAYTHSAGSEQCSHYQLPLQPQVTSNCELVL
jgi:hypothetical protein